MNKPIFSFPLKPLARAISVSQYHQAWKALLLGSLAGSLSLAEAFELSDLDGNNGFAIEGQNANEQLGKSVNGAGDVFRRQ